MEIIFGAGCGLLTLLLLGFFFGAGRQKGNGRKGSPGLIVQSVGFGFLPGAAVFSAFITWHPAAQGIAVVKPFEAIPFFTENGLFLPARMEGAAAALCFLFLCGWLIGRKKEDLPEGDLLMISACLWAAIRIISELFRASSLLRFGTFSAVPGICCLVMILCLGIWSHRRNKRQQGRMLAIWDWVAVAFCAAVVMLTSWGVLSLGSGVADLAVIAGADLLMLTLILFAGADSRRAYVISGKDN